MLSLQFTRSGYARRCAALASLMPSLEARDAFNPFMLTLLARRVASGKVAGDVDERRVVEGMWLDPLVQRRWRRLALRLTEADCKRIGRITAERGLAGSGIRWLRTEGATEGWALESAGYAVEDVGCAWAAKVRHASPTSTPFAARRLGVVHPASRNAQVVLAINNDDRARFVTVPG